MYSHITHAIRALMRRSVTDGNRPSRRAGAALAVLPFFCLALVLAAPSHATDYVTISNPGGPIDAIYLGNDLSVQVKRVETTALQVYPPSTRPGDFGTFVVVNGWLYAPDFGSRSSATGINSTNSTPFTPVSQSPVTGSGTAANPYSQTTIVRAGITGIEIEQTVTYVAGEEFINFSTKLSKNAINTSPQTIRFYRAMDCYLGSNDYAYGMVGTKMVGCPKNVDNTPNALIEAIIWFTDGAYYREQNYSVIWSNIRARTHFNNECLGCSSAANPYGKGMPGCSAVSVTSNGAPPPSNAEGQSCGSWNGVTSSVDGYHDNGIGYSVDVTLGPDQSQTLKDLVVFSPTGQIPCTANNFVPAMAAANSNQVSADTSVYVGTYDNDGWSGHLYAYPFITNAGGDGLALSDTASWDAANVVPGYDNRRNKIFTWSPSRKGGTAFTWDGIDPGQKNAFEANNLLTTLSPNWYDGRKMLAYIAGDRSNESPNGVSPDKYRKRNSLLGDIIGSSPVYVTRPNLTYPDSLEPAKPYSTFKSSNASRTPMIYVGANDGMLHAFRASDGVEQFAYVPTAVFSRLSDLASESYVHQFYVDGTPLVADALLGANWHTVLVGGLNAGGQGIYALDVTKPGSFTESSVLWEFGDRQTAIAAPANNIINFDADLGYTYGTPYIGRARTSGSTTKWVAIFGNGYKNTENDGVGTFSTTGNAVLYVVDLQNGNLIRKLNTGRGSSQDPSGVGTPNGLMSPTPVDMNGDGNVDYVYAGDLHGNMWKFDLTSDNPTNWKVAFSGAPLFTATGPGNKPQPITAAPEVGHGPSGGIMVYFGTGKIFETEDNATKAINSFYGVWDNMSSAVAGRSKLVQQTLTEVTASGATWRTITNNPVNWSSSDPAMQKRGWFVDLTTDSAVLTTERVISSPQLDNGRILFTSVVPSASDDGCSVSGMSWLMELDPLSGSALAESPFDVNGDGFFNSADLIPGENNGKYVPVGRRIQGLASAPLILAGKDGGTGKTVVNTSESGNPMVEDDPERKGMRWSWRDLSISQ